MATKTFKPGEYSYYPKWKVVTWKDEVSVAVFNWEGEMDTIRHFDYSEVDVWLNDWLESIGTPYYASIVRDWVKSTKEYYNKNLDPFTTYTFNLK